MGNGLGKVGHRSAGVLSMCVSMPEAPQARLDAMGELSGRCAIPRV